MAGGGRLRGVIALDGPSGTGKSTVARQLARRLKAAYLDTGGMYRAVTLAVLRAGVDPGAVQAVAVAVATATLAGTDPGHPTISLDGEDVSAEVRGRPVTAAVSAVAALPAVRTVLVAEQRRLIAAALDGGPGGIVVEGRDVGTVVVPDAGLKVFLTASDRTRAARRGAQDRRPGQDVDLEATLADVQRRDALDSGRVTSPLRAAPDAVTVDTTELDVAGVLAELTRLARVRGLVDPAGEDG